MSDHRNLCEFYEPRTVEVVVDIQPVLVVNWYSVCQVLWRQTIQRIVNQNGQLKFNMPSQWQQMKLLQDGRDVLVLSSTSSKRAVAFCTASGRRKHCQKHQTTATMDKVTDQIKISLQKVTTTSLGLFRSDGLQPRQKPTYRWTM